MLSPGAQTGTGYRCLWCVSLCYGQQHWCLLRFALDSTTADQAVGKWRSLPALKKEQRSRAHWALRAE
jgi:hypothetical protein